MFTSGGRRRGGVGGGGEEELVCLGLVIFYVCISDTPGAVGDGLAGGGRIRLWFCSLSFFLYSLLKTDCEGEVN